MKLSHFLNRILLINLWSTVGWCLAPEALAANRYCATALTEVHSLSSDARSTSVVKDVIHSTLESVIVTDENTYESFLTEVQRLDDSAKAKLKEFIYKNYSKAKSVETQWKLDNNTDFVQGLTSRRLMDIVSNQIVSVKHYFKGISENSSPDEVLRAYKAYFDAVQEFWRPLGRGHYSFDRVLETLEALQGYLKSQELREYYVNLPERDKWRNLEDLHIRAYGSVFTGRAKYGGQNPSDLDLGMNHNYYNNERRLYFEENLPLWLSSEVEYLKNGLIEIAPKFSTTHTSGDAALITNLWPEVTSEGVRLTVYRGEFKRDKYSRIKNFETLHENPSGLLGGESFMMIPKE